jgi:diadenosine tetraphosphate (Ap4A) HIT family hydrolase
MNPEQYDRILTQYRRGCVFCEPDPALVLYAGPRFGVCFDVSPLVPGHLIIHSHEHHGCAGEVPRAEMAELDALRRQVTDLVRGAYGAATLYEHGRAGHCLSDGPEHRLCHHFHLHCVPGDLDVSDRLAPRFDRIDMAAYTEISDHYEQHGDYLYLEDDQGRQSYFVVNKKIERHLMRTLIAERLGHPGRADWRQHAAADMLRDGMAVLRGAADGIDAMVPSAAPA